MQVAVKVQTPLILPFVLCWPLTRLLVIEVHISGSDDIEELGKTFATAFDSLHLSEGFLDYFYGPKHGDSSMFVVVTKWGPNLDISDNERDRDSITKCIRHVFGRGCSIEKRQEMYA
jgi:hypothetical protein